MNNLSLILRAIKGHYRFDRVEATRGTVYGYVSGAGVAVGHVTSFRVVDDPLGVSVFDASGLRLGRFFKGAVHESRQKAL